MNNVPEPGEHLVLYEQGSATVVRVLQAALADAALPALRERLMGLLHGRVRPLIVDCRDLPSGSMEQMGPLLYDMVVIAHRRSPRIELCVIGDADQSTGDSKTLLMPPRFETVEAAGEALGDKRVGSVPVRFPTGQSSEKPLLAPRPDNQWLQSPPAQVALAILVIGLTTGLVSYSAIASFRSPVIPRRRSDPMLRVAIQGSVKAIRDHSLKEEASAVIVAWPAFVPKTKYRLSSEQIFRPQPRSSEPAILVARVDQSGRFQFSRGELTGAGADYHLLVISERITRSGPPPDDELKKLSVYLDDPRSLLGERQYQLLLVPTGGETAAEQSIVLADRSEPAAKPKTETSAAAPTTGGP